MKIFFSASESLSSGVIRSFEGCDFSHTGFVLENGMVYQAAKGGVHFAGPVEKYAANQKRFIVFDIIVPNERAGTEFLLEQIGKDYDSTALWGFLFWRDWSQEDAWYCSELLAKWFEVVGLPIMGAEKYNRIPVRLVLGITNALAESQKLLLP
jgi:uncharacterized protein YycO